MSYGICNGRAACAPDGVNRGGGAAGKKLTLRVVVNGASAEVEISPQASLESVVARALAQTHNVGRPPEDWELRTEAGLVIDTSASAESNGLVDGTLLFLSLKTGAAGA